MYSSFIVILLGDELFGVMFFGLGGFRGFGVLGGVNGVGWELFFKLFLFSFLFCMVILYCIWLKVNFVENLKVLDILIGDIIGVRFYLYI